MSPLRGYVSAELGLRGPGDGATFFTPPPSHFTPCHFSVISVRNALARYRSRLGVCRSPLRAHAAAKLELRAPRGFLLSAFSHFTIHHSHLFPVSSVPSVASSCGVDGDPDALRL